MNKIKTPYRLLGLVFLISACTNTNQDDLIPVTACEVTNVSYTTTLQPVVNAQCATAGCHADEVASGWNLSHYEGLRLVAEKGVLMPSLHHTGSFPMPKGMPKLDSCTIAKFQAWIDNGYPLH